jgi:hypothetical protein
MPRAVARLSEVARQFGAVVLDQWGVLHDGTRPYPGAVTCVAGLAAARVRLAVLSNSGRRAAPNAARIAAMGFDPAVLACVMTSDEALWTDLAAGRVRARRLCPFEPSPGDAADWASGLDVVLSDDPKAADAVLLMGLPDAGVPARALTVLVRGGLHAAALSGPGWTDCLSDLARTEGAPLPDLTFARLEQAPWTDPPISPPFAPCRPGWAATRCRCRDRGATPRSRTAGSCGSRPRAPNWRRPRRARSSSPSIWPPPGPRLRGCAARLALLPPAPHD